MLEGIDDSNHNRGRMLETQPARAMWWWKDGGGQNRIMGDRVLCSLCSVRAKGVWGHDMCRVRARRVCSLYIYCVNHNSKWWTRVIQFGALRFVSELVCQVKWPYAI